MNSTSAFPVNKIAEVTISFWVMKIIATTLGETAGDFIAHTLALGYVIGLGVTGVFLLIALAYQIRATAYSPAAFWVAIIATTTAGTEVSDMMDRTLGLGYAGGALLLIIVLSASLMIWKRRIGGLSVSPITGGEQEIWFWVAVVASNSLGTAFGDFLVDNLGLSYLQGAFVTMAVIGVVLALHYGKRMNETALFWAAFIFSRPFGATFGDFLTKPLDKGGLDLGTAQSSLISVALLTVLIIFTSRRTARSGDDIAR